ncbi:MAG: hypothetical protein A2V67_15290 [Deltaproteobacteria bacterium RBG_13_61_14]|nr:MAG: hypothetical protein A2V67_15290 [Deltaproteobacteria bacterium RBG_13_61_14]
METAYTVRLRGYVQTVTVKADPAAVRAYISNPANVAIPGLKFEGAERSPAENLIPTTGQTSPFVVRAVGINIQGRILVVRSDEEKLWLLLESPFGFHIQRWQFKPVKDGTQLTFQMEYELQEKGIKGQLGKITELVGLGEALEKGMDRMLAEVQVHFDPSLEADQLVALGVRGEGYEAFLQVYETNVGISAPPDRVEAWANNSENARMLMEQFQMENQYFSQFLELGPGQILYAPAVLATKGLKSKAELFIFRDPDPESHGWKIFALSYGIGEMIEIQIEAGPGGSLLTFKIKSEIPTALSSEQVDLMMHLLGIPQMLRDRALRIKNGVEQIG